MQVSIKKWYQSKIVAVAGTLVLVFGSNIFLHWMTGAVGVTPEQIQDVQQTVPAATDIVTRIRGGESLLSVAGSVVGLLLIYFRIFGTSQLIEQSIKK